MDSLGCRESAKRSGVRVSLSKGLTTTVSQIVCSNAMKSCGGKRSHPIFESTFPTACPPRTTAREEMCLYIDISTGPSFFVGASHLEIEVVKLGIRASPRSSSGNSSKDLLLNGSSFININFDVL